jgi:hypothetical protein
MKTVKMTEVWKMKSINLSSEPISRSEIDEPTEENKFSKGFNHE